MPEAFICDGVRTPTGRFGGALATVPANDLAAVPVQAPIDRNAADWGALDDVVLGCANQAGEDNRDVARMATLLAGLPVDEPGGTLERLCGSCDAVANAARMIRAGDADLVIAGGVESMSRAPSVMGKADGAFSRTQKVADTTIGWRSVNPAVRAAYGTDAMPATAEHVAVEYRIARIDQDAFAFRSQSRAAAAQANGRFDVKVVPVSIPSRTGDPVIVTRDEHPRATTREALAGLKLIVRADRTVTAGNASGVNDGAAALIVAGEAATQRHGLIPRARRRRGGGGRAAADHGSGADPGGALALGHPFGLSGARLALTASVDLERRPGVLRDRDDAHRLRTGLCDASRTGVLR